MEKKALNILVDEELAKKARNNGLVISRFIENQLCGYFNFIEGKSINHNRYSYQNNNSGNKNKDDKWAYGLVVMTSPSHGGGLRFKSG